MDTLTLEEKKLSKLDQMLAGAKFKINRPHQQPYYYVIENSGFGLEIIQHWVSLQKPTERPYQGDVEENGTNEHVLASRFYRLGHFENLSIPMSLIEIITE